MVKTIAKMTIPFPLFEEGVYDVSLDNKKARIIVKHLQQKEKMKDIYGYEISATGNGKVTMTPDPHGISQITKIEIEFPFYILPKKSFHIMPDGQRVGPVVDHSGQIQRWCLLYLNRMVEVFKWKTGQYWLNISGQDAILNCFDLYDDSNKNVGGEFGMFSFSGFGFLNKIKEPSDVLNDVKNDLKNEQKIPIYDVLYLDSIQFFTLGRFREAIVTINIALEMLISIYLEQQLEDKGWDKDKIKKEMDNVFDKFKTERILKKHFKRLLNRSIEENKELLKKLQQARNVRRGVVHPKPTYLDEQKTRNSMTNVLEVMNWVLEEERYLIDYV